MKRSRVFLGATTFCLAIAGVVAAKNTKGSTNAFYYTAAGVSHCKAAVAPCNKVPAATVTCRTAASQTKPYFTNNVCTTLLRYTKI